MVLLIIEDDNPIVFLFFVIAVVIFIAVATFFNKKKVILRELKKTDTTQISRAQQNEYVKIIGKAIGGNELLIAPFSGRKCLCYYVRVEKLDDGDYIKYIDEERFQNFFIENLGERAIIKPAAIYFEFRKTYFEIDHTEKSDSYNDAKPHLERFLTKHGKKSEGILGFNKHLRYIEGIIEVGETIAVKGIAQWKTITEPIDGYSYSRILTLHGTDKQKLIITDYPEALKAIQRKL